MKESIKKYVVEVMIKPLPSYLLKAIVSYEAMMIITPILATGGLWIVSLFKKKQIAQPQILYKVYGFFVKITVSNMRLYYIRRYIFMKIAKIVGAVMAVGAGAFTVFWAIKTKHTTK